MIHCLGNLRAPYNREANFVDLFSLKTSGSSSSLARTLHVTPSATDFLYQQALLT